MDVENIVFCITDVAIGLMLMTISIPLKDSKVAMNHFYGVRLRKSYTSDKNWYLLNSYGGKQLLIWSSVMVISGVVILFLPFNGNELFIALLAFLPLIFLLIPTLLIVRYSRSLSDK